MSRTLRAPALPVEPKSAPGALEALIRQAAALGGCDPAALQRTYGAGQQRARTVPEAPARAKRPRQPKLAERLAARKRERAERKLLRGGGLWVRCAAKVFRAANVAYQDSRAGLDQLAAADRVLVLALVDGRPLDSPQGSALVQLGVVLCTIAAALRRAPEALSVLRGISLCALASLVRHTADDPRGRYKVGDPYSVAWLTHALHHAAGPLEAGGVAKLRGERFRNRKSGEPSKLGLGANSSALHRAARVGLVSRWWQPQEGPRGKAPKSLPPWCVGRSEYALVQVVLPAVRERWRAVRALLRLRPELHDELPHQPEPTGPP